MDVKALYTNIPIDSAIESIKQLFTMFPSENSAKILACLEFVLKYNMLSFMGKIYLQIFGIAMGTSLAPMLANIFMALLEHKIN